MSIMMEIQLMIIFKLLMNIMTMMVKMIKISKLLINTMMMDMMVLI